MTLPYGNTKKIAETISETLNESGMEADLLNLKELKKLSAKDYDFMVLGYPTRFGTMSSAIKFFLSKVKTEEWMNKAFVAFDTENPENMEKREWSAAEKIAKKLREKKMNQLLPVLKAAVLGQKERFKKAKSTGRKTTHGNLPLN
jgi:menaquinone-dependent protoporphyrinogen IX oxidase